MLRRILRALQARGPGFEESARRFAALDPVVGWVEMPDAVVEGALAAGVVNTEQGWPGAAFVVDVY